MSAEDLRVILVGYGKMGHANEDFLKSNGVDVVGIVDPKVEGCGPLRRRVWEDANTAICFTSPTAGDHTTRDLIVRGMNVVVGTTAWYAIKEGPDKGKPDMELISELDDLAKEWGARVSLAANFSFAANAYQRSLRDGAPEMAAKGYRPVIFEVHKVGKEDISQTSKLEGELILPAYPHLEGLWFDPNRCIKVDEFEPVMLERARRGKLGGAWADVPKQIKEAYDEGRIPIIAVRYADHPGLHRVTFEPFRGEGAILMTTEAQGRWEYSEGALSEVLWLQSQEPGFYLRNTCVGEDE